MDIKNYPTPHKIAIVFLICAVFFLIATTPKKNTDTRSYGFDAKTAEASIDTVDNDINSSNYMSNYLYYVDTTINNNNTQTDNETEEDSRFLSVTVESGDTLSTIFEKAGIGQRKLYEILGIHKNAKKLEKLQIGQIIEFYFNENNELQTLSTQISAIENITLQATDTGFDFEHNKYTPETKIKQAYGVITEGSSLFLAGSQAGLTDNINRQLFKIFDYDIDFLRDIRPKDYFEVVYESKELDNKQIGTGNILAARFYNKGKLYTAIRFENGAGETTYYSAEGKPLHKMFIKTPVDFTRISSKFNLGRKHPILNKIRAHKGVDYAAPRGTPIRATAKGVVEHANWYGGYGKAIILKHGKQYKTLYAHMHGFAKNIFKGTSVSQGQIIGYVGTTGLSTGPHLHYEFQVNGVHVDPLSVKMIASDPLNSTELKKFKAQSAPLLVMMDTKKNESTMIASKR